MENRFSIGLVLCCLLSWGVTALLVLPFKRTKEEIFLAPPPDFIERFSFGFNSSMADSFWLRWIQDSDVCYSYFSPTEILPQEKPKAGDREAALTYNPRHKKCDQSWGFKMLDTVTKLDPKFLMPYMAGTMTLSVLVEDYEGTTVIFERGLKEYPDDWQLNFRAAYHFLFDKKDEKRAAELLTHSAQHGGPEYLYSLAARLFSRSNQLELGLQNLINFRKAYNDPESAGAKEVDKRIAELQAELAGERAKEAVKSSK